MSDNDLVGMALFVRIVEEKSSSAAGRALGTCRKRPSVVDYLCVHPGLRLPTNAGRSSLVVSFRTVSGAGALANEWLRGFEDRCNSLSTTNALRGERITAA